MMRGRYVMRAGELVPVTEAAPLFAAKTSHLACPAVISDAMPPTVSMANGQVYESKSGIEAATRRAGCRTVGNDVRPAREKARPNRAAIKDAVAKASARFERGERAT